MLKRRWIFPFGVLSLLGLAALACGVNPGSGGFNLNENFVLNSGEQRDGDQVIVANQITMQPESSINGDATLIADQVRMEGEIQGDAVIIADWVRLGNTAHITGDLSVCTNSLDQRTDAQVDGEIRRECNKGDRATASGTVQSGFDGWRQSFVLRLGSAIASSLLFGALAALTTVIFPEPLVRISRSARQAPAITGGTGCLMLVLAIGLSVIYAISLILIIPLALLPFVMIAWVALFVASAVGWVALAEPFGRMLFRWMGIEERTPMVTAMLGGIALALLVRIWSVFWFTEWITGIATLVLGSIGLGAVVLTRLGTQPYPQSDTGTSVVRSTLQ